MGFRVINGKLISVEDFAASGIKENKPNKSEVQFSQILSKELNKKDSFLISNHAADRLRNRNISFNESDMKIINEGINRAEQKGAKESLILYKDVALITSIKNRTIITAVGKNGEGDNVFTNIDSVVLL